MTGRDKMEAAFGGGSDEVPAVICYEGIYLRDHFGDITSVPWWFSNEPDVEKQVLWYREATEGIGQDWVTLPFYGLADYSEEDREHLSVQERSDGVFRLNHRTGDEVRLRLPDDFGADLIQSLDEVHARSAPETPEDIDRLIPPPHPRPDGVGRKVGGSRLSRRVSEESRHLYRLQALLSPFWNSVQLFGYEKALILTVDNPELLKYACERNLALAIEAARSHAARGTDAVWIEECFTDMLSPEAFGVLSMPYLLLLVDAVRSLGMKSVYYFAGNPAGKMDQIISSGADALSFEESKKNFRTDISDIVDAVRGRCTVLGNLDSIGILQDGTEAELRAEIARQIDAGRRNRGKFVMSLGSPVTPSTPVSRVKLYCDIVHGL